MANRELKYFDILNAKIAYAEGRNVTEVLRGQLNVTGNTAEIIEAAYDLQAGTYIEYAENNAKQATNYAEELASILDQHVISEGSLLDVGAGELTTLSLLVNKLVNKPRDILAFDISWSRIYKGMTYAKKNMGSHYARLTPFVGDICEIPLLDKSINITTSNHALEPNGGKLKELMAELFRITVDKLVLFEPCYEINTNEGRQRMDALGYIKNIDGVVEKLGGVIVEKSIIKHTSNPLNPTVCFVIKPPSAAIKLAMHNAVENNIFSVPGSNLSLTKLDNYFFSNDTGLAFPVIKSIPILKSTAAILTSALCR